MRHLALLLVLFIFVTKSFPQVNYSNFDHYFGVELNTGCTFYDLSPLKNGFKSDINSINQNYDIPLEVQRLYPDNISWSGYVFWYFSPGLSLIVGPEYTSTKAFSRYADYSGTLDVKSEFREIYFSADIRNHFYKVKSVQPFWGVGLFLTHVSYKYNIDLTVNKEHVPNGDIINSSDVGYGLELCAGFDCNIKIAVLELVAAYKYVTLENLSINPDTFNIRVGLQKGVFK